jgi:aspartate racemase
MRGAIMKTIGLLGGMSFESTTEYYKLINRLVQAKLGGSHSAKILMYSFDYYELEKLLEEKRWDLITDVLVEQGKKLKEAGAEGIVLCANTMHVVADEVEKQVGLPLIHIVKSTLKYAMKHEMKKLFLLGTVYTMDHPIYKEIFKNDNIEIIVPDEREKTLIHRTIYLELIKGVFSNESKKKFIDIIQKYELKGIEGVILGCTEIPLLIRQEDVELPILNTMDLHINDVVEYILS